MAKRVVVFSFGFNGKTPYRYAGTFVDAASAQQGGERAAGVVSAEYGITPEIKVYTQTITTTETDWEEVR